MQNELITDASKLFPTFDHWQSFLELLNQKDAIKDFWFIDATTRIRRHFMDSLNTEWGFEPFGSPQRDTRWFLREFGPDSLAISFAFYYRFDLKIWNAQRFAAKPVTDGLKTSDFGSVLLAFGQIDRQGEWGSELIQTNGFSFGEGGRRPNTDLELAWFAAHETEAFVAQAVEKIERFTSSQEATEALRKLNQMAQIESQALHG